MDESTRDNFSRENDIEKEEDQNDKDPKSRGPKAEGKDVSELSVRAKRNLFLAAMNKPPEPKPAPRRPVRRAFSFQSKPSEPPAHLVPKPKPRAGAKHTTSPNILAELENKTFVRPTKDDMDQTADKRREVVSAMEMDLPENASLSAFEKEDEVSKAKSDTKEELETQNKRQIERTVKRPFSLQIITDVSLLDENTQIEDTTRDKTNKVATVSEEYLHDEAPARTYAYVEEIVENVHETRVTKQELLIKDKSIKESTKDIERHVVHISEEYLPDEASRCSFENEAEIVENVHKTRVNKQEFQVEDISSKETRLDTHISIQIVKEERPSWDKTQEEGSSDEESDWENIPEAEKDEEESNLNEEVSEDNDEKTKERDNSKGTNIAYLSIQRSKVDERDNDVHLSKNTDFSNAFPKSSVPEITDDDFRLRKLQRSIHAHATEYERASDIVQSISIDINKKSITEKSVKISWPDKSLKEDEWFVIYFKEENIKRWRFVEKYMKENYATVDVLEPDKTYQFRIKIKDDEEDSITNYSEVSDAVTTHLSEVQVWKKKSKKAKHSDNVWILPTNEVMAARDERHMTRKLVLSDSNEINVNSQKTILVLGATGSGKSTWIDSLANYVLGAEWDGDRFQIVSLEAAERQREADPTKSLTEWITCYTIIPSKATEGRLSFILNILDTPGIGDTRGISRDEEIVKQIEGLFHKEGEGGIKHIDAICFVFPAPQTRLTASQRYVCETMVALFGKDVAPNIVTITTFFDGHEPNVLNTLKALRIPYKPWFAFNNGGLYKSIPADENEKNKIMLRAHWEQNITNFQHLFETLKFLEPKTLLLTVEVLEKRRSRYHTQDILQTQIKQALDVVWALEQEIDIFVQNKSEIVKNKNFKYSIDDVVLEKRKLPSGASYQATNCKVCKYTCHLECPKDKKNIKTCIAMDQEGYCMSCPKYCHYSKHTKSTVVLERNQRKVEKTFKGKISEYNLREKSTENVIAELKERVDSYENRITSLVSILQGIDEELQEKALRHNPADTADYFDQMIQTEKTERKKGYKNRIQALEKCKGMDIDKDTKAFFDRAKLAEQKLHEAYQKERRGIFGHIMDVIAKPFK